jgi:pyridinium-3,5-bisthiocarboxylic acid mononucleotide nickel chelatase
MSKRRILFSEPFSGISGDMFIAALLDLGLDFERLKQQLLLLPIHGYELRLGECVKAGIHAKKFDVLLEHEHEHEGHHSSHSSQRTSKQIIEMIRASALPDWVKEKSIETFRRLAQAEGRIHNQSPEEVHFHEVGAIDSIVDIVGAAIGLHDLGPFHIVCSSVNVGTGTLTCQHGIYPVPGPATQELLKGIPIFTNSVSGELTTPTGAALLATFVEGYLQPTPMRVTSCGYGAGTRDTPGNANVLRLTVGEETNELPTPLGEKVAVIECEIDDMSPQIFGYLQERALAAGVLDIHVTPVQMKKGRPGAKLTLICSPDQLDRMSELVFAETTTIGVRYTFADRKTLRREFADVTTEFGAVRVKTSFLENRRINFVPEYEDCRRIAAERRVALKEVQAAAIRAYLEQEQQRS